MKKEFVITLQQKPSMLLIALKGKGIFHFEAIDEKGTLYFRRKKEVAGEEVLEFPMPVAPKKLLLVVSGQNFSLSVKKTPLEISKEKFSTEEHQFFKHILEFVAKFSTLHTGIYTDEQGRFPLVLSTHIRDRNTGAIKQTPARVSRITGQIEVSQTKFSEYSLPMQVFILLHEYSHYKLNTSSETESDLQALRWYLALGFPQTEAIYAHTKIFNAQNPEHFKRVQQLLDYVKHYNRSEGHYCFAGCACGK